jgi:hypothetical protein
LTVALSLSACSKTPAPSSFLAKDGDRLFFLQWTNSQREIEGSLIMSTVTAPAASVSPSPSASDATATPAETIGDVETKTDTFTGSLVGSNLSLTLVQDIGVGTKWTGALQGTKLTVSYSAADGTMVTLAFLASTIDAYNSALAIARTSVSDAGASQAALADAAKQKEILDGDVAAVNAAIKALGKDVDKADADLAPITTQLSIIAVDVNTARTEKAAANHRKLKSDICAAASAASAAAAGASSASAAAISASNAETADISRIVTDSKKLTDAWAQLKGDLVLYKLYTPTDLPKQKQIDASLGSATTASTANAKEMASDLAKAATQATIAGTLAADAQSSCANA